LTQPTLPFGRTGSRTSVQPATRRRTRKTSGPPSAVGFENVRNGRFACGERNTPTLRTVEVATMLMPDEAAAEASAGATTVERRSTTSTVAERRSPKAPPLRRTPRLRAGIGELTL
jgi:hypothetical protein